MALRRLLRWIDGTGFRTSITPTIVQLTKISDGSSVAPVPTIARLGTSSVFYFDHSFTEDHYYVADSGDVNMPKELRYNDGVAGLNDANIAIITTPTGLYTISVVSKTATDDIIPNVLVAVKNQAGQTVRTVTTDSNGEASFSLDNGDYTYQAYKAMTNMTNGSFTISSINYDLDIIGTIITPTTPAADLQTIYWNNLDLGLAVDSDVTIYAEAITPNQEKTGEAIITGKRVFASLVDDHYEIQVSQGAYIRLVGEGTNGVEFLNILLTVTTDATKDLVSYI